MVDRVFLRSLKDTNYLKLFQEGLEFIHFQELLPSNGRVFLKLNLTFPEYRKGVMTNPQAVSDAILAIRDYTPNIYIGDSDSGGYNRFSMDEVYQTTGIQDIAQKNGVKIINLSKCERRLIQFSYKRQSFALPLPVLLLDEIDLLVTMPVPKIHANTGVSLTFKNQWGCIPENKDRLRLHPYFQHVILEVNKAVKAKAAIIDGKYGLNKNGPMKGEPVQLDWVLLSNSLGSGAQVACDLMKIPLNSIPHLNYAKKLGWIPDRSLIQYNQEWQPFVREQFYLRRKLTDFPGYLAFHNSGIAYLAYFSPISEFLHRLLYLVREPFYDYDRHRPQTK